MLSDNRLVLKADTDHKIIIITAEVVEGTRLHVFILYVDAMYIGSRKMVFTG